MSSPLLDKDSTVFSPELSLLETAVWRTVAYMDVFDYPLTAVEIHRYLEKTPATLADVEKVLANGRLRPQHLTRTGHYYSLAGREETAAIRQTRTGVAQYLWPAAIRYGRLLANLPFVRMVAVTGSLAMDNVAEGADIDYLLVARNGRVWLSRAFAIAIVRLAARQGHSLCPNYILAERALAFPDRNLYTAHEVTQMIPLAGLNVYQRIRQINNWADTFLPNAAGPPRHLVNGEPQACSGKPEAISGLASAHYLRQLAELPLRTPLGQWLEQWEMQRKISKFQQRNQGDEAAFSPDWCKGHFDAHKEVILTAYQSRLHQPASGK